MKNFFLVGLLSLLFFPGVAMADSYVVNLFNDGENIRFDRFIDKVSLDSQAETILNLQNNPDETVTEYRVGLVSSNEDVPIIYVNIEPEEGAFSRLVPYYAHVREVQLTRGGQIIDTVNVSQFQECNSNGICELELGETESTCIVDCVRSQTQYSEETSRRIAENEGVIRDDTGEVLIDAFQTAGEGEAEAIASEDASTEIFNWRIVVGGALVLAGIGFFIYKIIRKFV